MKKFIIFMLSLFVLFIILLCCNEYAKYGIKEVTSSNIKDTISKNDYVFINYGKPTADLKKFAKKFKKNYRINTYYTYLNKEQLSEILSIVLDNNLQILFVDGKFKATSENTDIFIYPGYKFEAIDCLITNFHLPKSTLLMLISAFASKELIFKAYKEAVKEKYRFFSFGDSMMIL